MADNTQVINETEDFMERREMYMEAATNRRRINANYHDMVLTEMLGTALKGIYIGALQKVDVMGKQDYAFCEATIDKFIEEQGGASVVLGKMAGKTYLLSRIASIVEDATEDAEEKADEEDKAAGAVPDESKEKLFDELDKESDIDAAVDVIADRITQAEEEFVKKNAEDKKKIELIVHDINDRIQAAKGDEDLSDEAKEETEEELTKESAQLISEIYDKKRSVPLFEYMVRRNLNAVINDAELRSLYQTEGKIDTDKIIDTTARIFAFTECLNTLQIVKIDEAYIEKMIKELN